MWKRLPELLPHIVCYGCVLHILNLWVKDIFNGADVPVFHEALKGAKGITVEIKLSVSLQQARRRAADFYTTEDKPAARVLAMPIDTRFGSYIDTLERVIENEQELRLMADQLSPSSAEMVRSTRFWVLVKAAHRLLVPVSVALVKLQADNATLADAHLHLMRIDDELKKVLKEVNQRLFFHYYLYYFFSWFPPPRRRPLSAAAAFSILPSPK